MEVTNPLGKIEVAPDQVEFRIGWTSPDPLVVVSADDAELKRITADLMTQIGTPSPSVRDIITAVNERYPINPQATAAIRALRATQEDPLPLSQYFQPGEEAPYTAVCVHKALLAQAVASQYHLDTSIIDFGLLGQIRDGHSDGKSGLHSAIGYTNSTGEKRIGDPHKGIDTTYDEYWTKFDRPQIFFDDIRVFEP